MIADERKTALSTSVGADDEQLLQSSGTSITAEVGNCNGFYEKQSNGLSILPGGCLKTVTMNELLDSVFTGKPPIIEGLLYRDTYLFTGAPKVGKSFFMAQLAYHVSTGKALWGYSVRQGKVLYLALEDNYERLQKRLYRMFGEEGTDDLYLAASSGTLGDVLDKQLIKFLTDNPDTCLVIIDTLKRIRETDDSSCSYNEDYDTIMKLKGFADRRGICLMLVHHNRKLRSEDIFEMISGSNGLFGAADGAFVLDKEQRGSDEATLYVTGRDQPEAKLHLKRDPESLLWDLTEAETDEWKEPPDPDLDAISNLLNKGNTIWHGSPTELAEAINTDLSANSLTRKLNANKQRLFNEYGILYDPKKIHEGRRIRLTLQQRDDSVGCDDIIHSGGSI
ncbi:MAG: AAA family ATPase [Firmicutes bacterium]|nr:AAA family ATPase [Bacillota bacterium]